MIILSTVMEVTMIKLTKSLHGYSKGETARIVSVNRRHELAYGIISKLTGKIAWVYPWRGDTTYLGGAA